MRAATVGLRGAKENRVVGVSLYMFLEILRAFERFPTEVALMRLQWNVDTNMRGDMVTFHSGGAAVAPLASQVQVVGALATDMALANVILEKD